MKKIYTKALFFSITIGLTTLLHSAETQKIFDIHTYKGTELTKETVPQLMRPMPKKRAAAVALWSTEHAKLLTRLAHGYPKLFVKPKKYIEFAKRRTKLLAQHKLHNNSVYNRKVARDHNFVFPIQLLQDKTMYVKIAGSETRFNYAYNTQEIPAIDSFKALAFMAHYLKMLETKERYNLTHIHVPPTYIVRIPGKEHEIEKVHEPWSDEHCYILQKEVPNWQDVSRKYSYHHSLAGDPKQLEKISDDTINQLHTAITEVGLWDPNPENIMVQDDGSLMLIDLEGSSRGRPEHFFYKNNEEYQYSVLSGLTKAVALFTYREKKQATLIAIIRQNYGRYTAGASPETMARYQTLFNDSERAVSNLKDKI